MSALDLLQNEALLDDEEDDESFDEETGKVTKERPEVNGGQHDDSSEEDLDDEDEDAARAVCPLGQRSRAFFAARLSCGEKPVFVANGCGRSERALSSTKTRRSTTAQKSAARRKSAGAINVIGKTRAWMKKICI